jgi:hypothetical protein
MSNIVKAAPPLAPLPPAPAADNTLPIGSMIERIMSDPNIPMERVEQAFAFYQKVQADQARKAFTAAFAQMQPALPAIERKGQSHNGKYARWEDIAAGIMPVLAAHGFGLSFRIKSADRHVLVTCILSHKDGHSEETEHPFPYDTSGSKTANQAIGSATSYGKRYTANAVLGIATRDEEKDDDGNAAGGLHPIDDEQAAELMALITATKSDISKFLQVARAESLSDVLAKDFERLKAMLLKKRGGQ